MFQFQQKLKQLQKTLLNKMLESHYICEKDYENVLVAWQLVIVFTKQRRDKLQIALPFSYNKSWNL